MKSLEGLYLTSFDASKIKVSRKVQEFYLSLEESKETKRETISETVAVAVAVAVAIPITVATPVQEGEP